MLDRLALEHSPASVRKFADFLNDFDPFIASAAAWRVSPLLRVATVPRTGVSDGPLPRGPADWAWAPFGLPAAAVCMASQVVHLLATSPDESVPDPPPHVPPEIAIPALVLLAAEIAALPIQPILYVTSLTRAQRAQLEDLIEAHPSVASGPTTTQNSTSSAHAKARSGATSSNTGSARSPQQRILKEAGARPRVTALLNGLPGGVQEALTQSIKFGRQPVPNDWLRLCGAGVFPSKPLLSRKLGKILLVLGLAAALWMYFSADQILPAIAALAIGAMAYIRAIANANRYERDSYNPLESAQHLVTRPPR